VGTRLEFTSDYPVYGGGVIPRGTVGTIDDIDEDNGTAWLQLPLHLGAYRDHVALNPFTCPELAECVRVKRWSMPGVTRRQLAMAAVVVAAFSAGFVIDPPQAVHTKLAALGLINLADYACP
jgi:hypothetical protein